MKVKVTEVLTDKVGKCTSIDVNKLRRAHNDVMRIKETEQLIWGGKENDNEILYLPVLQ